MNLAIKLQRFGQLGRGLIIIGLLLAIIVIVIIFVLFLTYVEAIVIATSLLSTPTTTREREG